MFGSFDVVSLARNLAIYGAGVGLAVVGALGLAAAIDLDPVLSGVLLAVGLGLVLVVHEYLGGPVPSGG